MCDISTIFSVVSGIVGFISDSQEADNQDEFNRQQAEANRINAENNARIQADQVNQRQAQDEVKAAQEIAEVRRDALQARARARVAAGEAGVAGISVEALQRDFGAQEGRFVDATTNNLEFARAANKSQIQAIQNRASGRIAATRAQPVARPSFFGAALRIGARTFDSIDRSRQDRPFSTSTFTTSVQKTRRSTQGPAFIDFT